MKRTYTPDDLRAYLDRRQIQAQLLSDIGHTPTVAAAAEVLQVHPDQIVKTLLFVVQRPDTQVTPEAEPTIEGIIVISHGERRVNTNRLAKHLGVASRAVRLAKPEIVLERLGYPAGGVPPFGHRMSHPVLLEKSLLATRQQFGDRVYAGGGDDRTMMETDLSELIRVLNPEFVTLST